MSDPITRVSCLCGAVRTPLGPLLASATNTTPTLPLSAEICHCDTCRYTSGALTGIFLTLASPPPSDQLAQCIPYASSAKVTRYFCRTCGSKTFLKGYSGDPGSEKVEWFLWGGVVERGTEHAGADVNRVDMQIFVEDALDAGLLGRMVQVSRTRSDRDTATNGARVLDKVYNGDWNGSVLTADELNELVEKARERVQEKTAVPATGDKKLLAKCHCGAVQFHVLKPHKIDSVRDEMKWFLRQDNTKYLARLCTCRSCRLGLGHPLQPWMYAPPECIVTLEGQPLDTNSEGDMKLLSGVRSYRSSEDVRRTFCGTCGASVFYEYAKRPFAIDISVGILRSEVGALAEDWLVWDWDTVSSQDECCDRELLDSLTSSA